MTAPTPDAVAQEVEDTYGEVIAASMSLENNGHAMTERWERDKNRKEFNDALARFRAAVTQEAEARVRAECAAKVRALPNWSSKHDSGPWVNRDEVLATLEAHP